MKPASLPENINPTVQTEKAKPILQTSNLASKIQKSSQPIKSENGSLPIYKIRMVQKMHDKQRGLAKLSFGEPGKIQKSSDKVLMVVGATGAGKTTLINGMINYLFDVKWEDKFRFKLVIDECEQNQAHSQTSMITAYTIYPQEGSRVDFTLTVIDTPGFGDTRGMKHDKLITQQIQDFFSVQGPNGIDHLDGIGFVTQASLARLTPTQNYIFHSILSIFGTDVANNIFMMVTFADGQHPPVMTAIKEAQIPCTDYYKFNNSALFACNKAIAAGADDDDGDNFDAMFWKMGFISFKKFFNAFVKKETVSLCLTKEVLRERKQLEVTVQELQKQINAGVSKLGELRQEEIVLQQREAEIATNKDFTYKVKVTKQRKVMLDRGVYVTNCLQCNYTCHPRCAFADDRDKYKCSAMDNGGEISAKCRICPGNCGWKQHVNNQYYFELYDDFETRTSKDLQTRFHSALEGKNKVQAMMKNMDNFLKRVEACVMGMVKDVQRSMEHLDKIALRPNPLTQTEHLELLIQSEKQQAKPGHQQRIQFYEHAKQQALIMKEAKGGLESLKGNSKTEDKEPWYTKLKFWS